MTDLELLQIELEDIKTQIKLSKDFNNGVPPPFGRKYQESEYGYKIVDDESIPYNNEEFDRVYLQAVRKEITEEDFNNQIQYIKYNGVNRFFKAAYAFEVMNLIPDNVKLAQRIKF